MHIGYSSATDECMHTTPMHTCRQVVSELKGQSALLHAQLEAREAEGTQLAAVRAQAQERDAEASALCWPAQPGRMGLPRLAPLSIP